MDRFILDGQLGCCGFVGCDGSSRYFYPTRILIVCMSFATAFPEWEGRSIVGVELSAECFEPTSLRVYLIQSGYSRRNRIVTDSRFWCRTKGVCFVVISHFSLLSVPVGASMTVFRGVGPYTVPWRFMKGRASRVLSVLSSTADHPSSSSSWSLWSSSCCTSFVCLRVGVTESHTEDLRTIGQNPSSRAHARRLVNQQHRFKARIEFTPR